MSPAVPVTLEVQVFGVRKSADTRKALRFFSERRIRTHFVDFEVRGPSVGELRRFAQHFGVPALIDRDSAHFAAQGLQHAAHPEARWLQKLSEDPLLLHMPLVRCGRRLAIGVNQAEWTSWLRES